MSQQDLTLADAMLTTSRLYIFNCHLFTNWHQSSIATNHNYLTIYSLKFAVSSRTYEFLKLYNVIRKVLIKKADQFEIGRIIPVSSAWMATLLFTNVADCCQMTLA